MNRPCGNRHVATTRLVLDLDGRTFPQCAKHYERTKMRTQKDGVHRIVYSTEHGKMCPDCSKPIAECVCAEDQSTLVGDGIVRIRRETKGRRGKSVTVIDGIPLGHLELIQVGKQLKKRCGTGGTVKDGVVEIQGDHREILMAELKRRGWTVKRSGG